ncbi:MAG: hypothetical protein RLN83_06795 [Balneola sp.]
METYVIEPVFRNLAIINVILGGLGLVFISSLFSKNKDSKNVQWTVITSLVSSTCFFISAIFSTSAITYTYYYNSSSVYHMARVIPEVISAVFYFPSVTIFFIGFLFLSGSIGLYGWVFSRKVGIASSIAAIALFVTSLIMAIVTFFIL